MVESEKERSEEELMVEAVVVGGNVQNRHIQHIKIVS